MGKTMTKSERMVLEWLTRRYGVAVRYRYNKSPDFILPDGTMFEAKYLAPSSNTIYFTRKQWDELHDNVNIVVVGDSPEPLCVVPFGEIKRSVLEGKPFICGGRRLVARIEQDVYVLRIKCRRETAYKLKKFMVENDFDSYDDALSFLLDLADKYKYLFPFDKLRKKAGEVY